MFFFYFLGSVSLCYLLFLLLGHVNALGRNVEDHLGYPLVSVSCFTVMSRGSLMGGRAWARIPNQSCVLNLVCFRSISQAPYAGNRAFACIRAIVHSPPCSIFTCSMSLSTVRQTVAAIDVMWHEANLGWWRLCAAVSSTTSQHHLSTTKSQKV